MYDSGVSAGPPPLIRPQSWEQVFAWLPVHIHGKRKWLTKVWRREIVVYGDRKNEPPRYEYGTLFDVIKDKE
jgi:hypothetical protein